jgi:hypothetical protein
MSTNSTAWEYAVSATSNAASKVYVLSLSELDTIAISYVLEQSVIECKERTVQYKFTCTEPLPMLLYITSAPNGSAFSAGFSDTPTTLEWVLQDMWNGSQSAASLLEKKIMRYNDQSSLWECTFTVNLAKVINQLTRKKALDPNGSLKEVRLVAVGYNYNGITNPTTVALYEQGYSIGVQKVPQKRSVL